METRTPSPLFDTLEYFKEHKPNFKNYPVFAPNDFEHAKHFLKQYDGNEATFNTYRREVERLLHWSWLIAQKSILQLRQNDIENYVKFCQKPLKSWIGFKKVARFLDEQGLRIANPEWKPFVVTQTKIETKKGTQLKKEQYALSQKATKEIFVILGSFYNFLLHENILEANPVLLIRQKSKFIRKTQTAKKIPRLSDSQWETLILTAEKLADANPERHERTLFIVTAMYLMYLRISEFVASTRWAPIMSHFYQDSDAQWWFITVGKGNKERHITVSDGMITALKRFRTFLGLTPLPSPQDQTPLVPKIKGQGNITSDRWIREIVQECFDAATHALEQQGQQQDAIILASATAHWLRHTGISDDINKRGRPISHVRDDAGHASIVTTDRYNDITLRERHASGKRKQVSN